MNKHRNSTRVCVGFLLAALISSLTGCTTLIKQAYYEIHGAGAEIKLNEDMGDRTLLNYKSVRFMPLERAVGERIVPAAFVQSYDHTSAEVIVDLKGDYPGGEPSLTVKSEVLYFQAKGMLSSALALTRVRIFASEKQIIDAMVLAETKAFREGSGDESLAAATVNAIGKMLSTRKNPETYDEKEEQEREEKERKDAEGSAKRGQRVD